jgi:hypothetical protein
MEFSNSFEDRPHIELSDYAHVNAPSRRPYQPESGLQLSPKLPTNPYMVLGPSFPPEPSGHKFSPVSSGRFEQTRRIQSIFSQAFETGGYSLIRKIQKRYSN